MQTHRPADPLNPILIPVKPDGQLREPTAAAAYTPSDQWKGGDGGGGGGEGALDHRSLVAAAAASLLLTLLFKAEERAG